MASEAVKLWYQLRVKNVHEKVSVYSLLRRHGVSFKHTMEREEQISCPFHGKDENPSCRVYPASGMSPSHAWCFVCRERWDVIALWKKYSGESKSFHEILSEIEKQYGIVQPPVPEGDLRSVQAEVSDVEYESFHRMYEVCERRLLGVRDDYTNDMNGFLLAGSILDKLHYQVEEGQLSPKEGTEVLNRLLQKIGERIRRGTASQAPDS